MTTQTTTIPSLLDQRRQFLGFVEKRVMDRYLAEDILQTAYMRALQHEGALHDGESAVAWFYRILRNAIIDHYRRRTTESAALERWAKELETETAPNEDLQNTACSCVDKVLDKITPGYAALLREVDLKERPLNEFAAEQGITAGNAAVRAHRARTALRKELVRTCGTCAEHGCLDCTCKSASA
ncbi:MAG: sigma-70 family RNA polymerase sigma factor [Acidobacteria bacterium]|nr:sigma-70 family RNA polymerase sigma factor [Acidobacteriota bacterium]